MTDKTVVVLGASINPQRMSYEAINRLSAAGYRVVAVGRRPGNIGGVEIQTGTPETGPVYALSLYLNAANQVPYYPYILSMRPGKVIFNPGTENPELEALAALKGIATEQACTLVMLTSNQF